MREIVRWVRQSAMFGAAALAMMAAGPTKLSIQVQAQPRQTVLETVSRSVFSEQRTLVWRSYAINNDCTTIRGFNVRVDRLPKNGKVALEKISVIIDQSLINFRVPAEQIARIQGCYGKEVPAIAVYYTSNPGHSGFDDMELTITSASRNRQRTVEMKIAVR
jgi:hypothetical protein